MARGNKPGVNNSNARFNADEVRKIRKLWRTGRRTAAELAARFNVKPGAIDNLVSGKTYPHFQLKKVDTKRRLTQKGEKNNQHKLTNKQVRKIKKLLRGIRGELTELGKQFNVTKYTIARIRDGKGWGHIK